MIKHHKIDISILYGLKWPTPLETASHDSQPALTRSPPYPSRFHFSLPCGRILLISGRQQQTLAVRRATSTYDKMRAVCGYRNDAVHDGSQFFFCILEKCWITKSQILGLPLLAWSLWLQLEGTPSTIHGNRDSYNHIEREIFHWD